MEHFDEKETAIEEAREGRSRRSALLFGGAALAGLAFKLAHFPFFAPERVHHADGAEALLGMSEQSASGEVLMTHERQAGKATQDRARQ